VRKKDDLFYNYIFLGILAGIVAFLVMVTVIVIVIIRNRKLNQNGCGETHISFSADIDRQVSFNSDEDSYTEKSKSYS
jgi:hypothetical protein